jgi:predicted amidohydrolase YtcJ
MDRMGTDLASGSGTVENRLKLTPNWSVFNRPEARRLRIEHFTITAPEQLVITKKLGVVPGFTIGHVHYWGEPFHNQIVGPARANRIDPSASMKKEGVRFAHHSDSPVSPYGPLKYITQGVRVFGKVLLSES